MNLSSKLAYTTPLGCIEILAQEHADILRGAKWAIPISPMRCQHDVIVLALHVAGTGELELAFSSELLAGGYVRPH